MVTVRVASQKDLRALSERLLALIEDKNGQAYKENVARFGIPDEYVKRAFSEASLVEAAKSGNEVLSGAGRRYNHRICTDGWTTRTLSRVGSFDSLPRTRAEGSWNIVAPRSSGGSEIRRNKEHNCERRKTCVPFSGELD